MGVGLSWRESHRPGQGQGGSGRGGYALREGRIGGQFGSVVCALLSFLGRAGWLPAPGEHPPGRGPQARPGWAVSPRAFTRQGLKE